MGHFHSIDAVRDAAACVIYLVLCKVICPVRKPADLALAIPNQFGALRLHGLARILDLPTEFLPATSVTIFLKTLLVSSPTFLKKLALARLVFLKMFGMKGMSCNNIPTQKPSTPL